MNGDLGKVIRHTGVNWGTGFHNYCPESLVIAVVIIWIFNYISGRSTIVQTSFRRRIVRGVDYDTIWRNKSLNRLCEIWN